MVQEKDAELEANKEKEMKAVAHGKSLVFKVTVQLNIWSVTEKLI